MQQTMNNILDLKPKQSHEFANNLNLLKIKINLFNTFKPYVNKLK